jgi:hypothetical protein
MTTNNNQDCHPALRAMTFQAAVYSLYKRSSGQVFLVAVKLSDEICINPWDGLFQIGACESVFVIAPSWDTVWELFTEISVVAEEEVLVEGSDGDGNGGRRSSAGAVTNRSDKVSSDSLHLKQNLFFNCHLLYIRKWNFVFNIEFYDCL